VPDADDNPYYAPRSAANQEDQALDTAAR